MTEESDEEFEARIAASAAETHARFGATGKVVIDGVVFDGDYYMAWPSDPMTPRPTDEWLNERAVDLWPIVARTRLTNLRTDLGADRWQVAWM